MSCMCEWYHPDCKNAVKETSSRIRCFALIDCEFPNRDDCPFYKPDKTYKFDVVDLYMQNHRNEMIGGKQ